MAQYEVTILAMHEGYVNVEAPNPVEAKKLAKKLLDEGRVENFGIVEDVDMSNWTANVIEDEEDGV